MEAGRRLARLRAGYGADSSDTDAPWRRAGPDPDRLRKAGDMLAHDFLAAELARVRPADAVLSEEGKDDLARLTADRVWIVDPLDGTREYGEPGRTDWAVHVALWERGDLVAGAVALPAQEVVFSTADPLPARPATMQAAQSHAELPALPSGLRLLVSRSRPPAFVRQLAADIGAELVPMGSAGAKAAAVIRGAADAYIHGGGQYEWDSAAPVAVARSAGLHASRIDGSALVYNQAAVSIPDILISPAWLAPQLITAIARASVAMPSVPASPRPATSSDPELS